MASKRILQNNRLLWVDSDIGSYLPFLNDATNEQALIITSGSLGQSLVEQIHHLPQVEAIYIFCAKNPDRHQSWISQWCKIRGVHNQITIICEVLQTAVKHTNEDLTLISFVTQNEADPERSTVDPTLRSAIFADVVELDKEQRLFEARLTLASADDAERTRLTDRIEEDIGDGHGWKRLAQVLLNIGKMEKAEELYLMLLEQRPDERGQALCYRQLGLIKERQGTYDEAVKSYERSILIDKQISLTTHSSLAISYNNIVFRPCYHRENSSCQSS